MFWKPRRPPRLAQEPRFHGLGTALARDDYLARNGCVSNATAPCDAAFFPACVTYTGCPVGALVVWCAIDSGHTIGANPTLQSQYDYNAIWKVWTTLRRSQLQSVACRRRRGDR